MEECKHHDTTSSTLPTPPLDRENKRAIDKYCRMFSAVMVEMVWIIVRWFLLLFRSQLPIMDFHCLRISAYRRLLGSDSTTIITRCDRMFLHHLPRSIRRITHCRPFSTMASEPATQPQTLHTAAMSSRATAGRIYHFPRRIRRRFLDHRLSSPSPRPPTTQRAGAELSTSLEPQGTLATAPRM